MFHFVKILGDFSRKFGESLAKAWRKMAFTRKLGGLNCGLVVSELADEGEQGPTFFISARKCLSAAAAE